MGVLENGPAQLTRALEALKSEYGPDDYNILTRNCNHFANALCQELLKRPIPGYLNRLAFVGEDLQLIPQPLLCRFQEDRLPFSNRTTRGQGSSSRTRCAVTVHFSHLFGLVSCLALLQAPSSVASCPGT